MATPATPRCRAALAALLLLATAPAQAGEVAPQHRTRQLAAFFWHDSPNDLLALAGIREALTTSGLDYQLTEHTADSDPARGGQLLQQLQGQKCDLLFAMGTDAVKLAKAQRLDIPVVYVAVTNPVLSGIVDSWQGSGSNLCGASNWIPSQNVVRVFQLAVPGLEKLGILRTKKSGTVSQAELAAMRDYLAEKGAPKLELIEAVADDHTGIEAAVQQLLRQQVQAIWIPIDIEIYQHVDAVRMARGSNHAPIVTTALQAAHAGACVAVVVDYAMLGRKAAALAIDVLGGGKPPGQQPVVTMHGYQVVVNLSAAHRAGIELPLSLLVLADELIVEENGNGQQKR